MRRVLVIVLCAVIILSACIAPRPTDSPIVTPSVTPGPSIIATPYAEIVKSPTPIATPSGGWIWNSGFEKPYVCPENATCVAEGWHHFRRELPPCRPGKIGCELPCPPDCRKDNGVCVADNGCYWSGSPEFSEATLQYPYRIHSGTSAAKIFSSGRMWEAGLYQQVYHVPMYSSLHFSAWAQAWQCADFITCRWGEISDQPAAMNIRVGIDPMGGIAPYAASVVWSAAGESFDKYSQFNVYAVATNQVVTVFIMGAPRWEWPRNHGNDLYVDDARLDVTPPAPQITPTPFVATNWVYMPVVLNNE